LLPGPWLSKSRGNNLPGRVLLVLGSGSALTAGLQAAVLFTNAGFEVRVGVYADVEIDESFAALTAVCGVEPLSSQAVSSMISRIDSFQASLGIGIPVRSLQEMTFGASGDAAVDLMIRKGGLKYLLLSADVPLTEHLASELRNSCFDYRWLPDNPFSAGALLDKVFSDIMGYLAREKELSRFKVVISRNIPVELANLAGRYPCWIDDLKISLEHSGFKPVFEGEGADLLIETYEGPYLGKIGRGKKIELSFDPSDAPPTPVSGLTAKFIGVGVVDKRCEELAVNNTMIVKLLPEGHIVVYESDGRRMFPKLATDDPFLKLAEFFAERLLGGVIF